MEFGQGLTEATAEDRQALRNASATFGATTPDMPYVKYDSKLIEHLERLKRLRQSSKMPNAADESGFVHHNQGSTPRCTDYSGTHAMQTAAFTYKYFIPNADVSGNYYTDIGYWLSHNKSLPNHGQNLSIYAKTINKYGFMPLDKTAPTNPLTDKQIKSVWNETTGSENQAAIILLDEDIKQVRLICEAGLAVSVGTTYIPKTFGKSNVKEWQRGAHAQCFTGVNAETGQIGYHNSWGQYYKDDAGAAYRGWGGWLSDDDIGIMINHSKNYGDLYAIIPELKNKG